MTGTQEKTKKSLMDRFLNVIERAGNKLPDPVSLFVLLAIVVIVLSAVLGAAGVSATHPGTGKVIKIVNLLSVDGFRMMWSKAVSNFANFAPLAMVLVCVIGSGVAEKSGFLAAFMQKMLGDAAPAVVTFVIIFIGINGNVAGDAAFVVLPPVAGVIFLSMGRHPLLGVFCGFASVAAGFCANVMLGMSDSLVMAEDNELNAQIAETLLEDQGAEVTVVYNGKQAADLFETNPAGTFDAILMDIMMPVMDGLTAARTIRALDRPDAKTIPIIAMTANAFKEDEEKCLEAGMNAHLIKPLDIEKVKQTIEGQVRVHQ